MPNTIDPIGAVQIVFGFIKAIKNWWNNQRPILQVLQSIADNNRIVRIFIRDFFILPGTSLFSKDRGGIGQVPNVVELWSRVEGIAIANILNVLGQVSKKENIEIIEMSKNTGLWDSNIIVLGAQAQKCFDFYKNMKKVAYYMDPKLRDGDTHQLVPKEEGYGYGIILKTLNPYTQNGIGLLIGGYGVLGTEAASYYFRKHCKDLGKKFGKKYFGIVVRVSVTAGIESTERIYSLDKCF